LRGDLTSSAKLLKLLKLSGPLSLALFNLDGDGYFNDFKNLNYKSNARLNLNNLANNASSKANNSFIGFTAKDDIFIFNF
jgi:hypothetical protein